MRPGLQSRLGFVNSGTGGFDSHALPPFFHRTSTVSTISIREYSPGDETAILAAFNASFAAVDPTFQPRDEAFWRWRFLDNPGGLRISLALGEEGEVLAQYAGLPVRARMRGQVVNFTQAVDSFVCAERGGGIGRAALFLRTGEDFAERYGGVGAERDLWMWGLPVPAAWRIGAHGLGYEMLGVQTALVASTEDLQPKVEDGQVVSTPSDLPPDFDAFFETQVGRFDAIGERNCESVRWRYLAHPENDYELFLTRKAGEITGYAVLRLARFEGRERGLICDWLCEEEARGALLEALAERTSEANVDSLYTWLPNWCEDWLPLQDMGFRVEPTGRFRVGRSYDRRIEPLWFAKHWYNTLGETDLV